MARLIGIKVTLLPDTDEQAIKAIEKLSHVLAGLALEEIDSEIQISPYRHEAEL